METDLPKDYFMKSIFIVSAVQTGAEAISYKYLRDKQLEVLLHFLLCNDVVAILPQKNIVLHLFTKCM